jgi:hypothetical protein
MPFDEEDPKEFVPKLGLKQVNGPKSMFDGKPRKPTQQQFQQQVQEVQEKQSGYKKRASELFIQFNRMMVDKTLPENRNIFNIESEKEVLQNMLQLAEEINNDPNEKEGMGSLTWITLLFKTCLSQRDRLNELEYSITVLQKKTDFSVLADFVNKEIVKALDKKKDGE